MPTPRLLGYRSGAVVQANSPTASRAASLPVFHGPKLRLEFASGCAGENSWPQTVSGTVLHDLGAEFTVQLRPVQSTRVASNHPLRLGRQPGIAHGAMPRQQHAPPRTTHASKVRPTKRRTTGNSPASGLTLQAHAVWQTPFTHGAHPRRLSPSGKPLALRCSTKPVPRICRGYNVEHPRLGRFNLPQEDAASAVPGGLWPKLWDHRVQRHPLPNLQRI